MMQLDAKFLRSRVARRIFLLFVSCALLPVAALAVISFFSVSQQLEEQSRGQLRQLSKAEGMEIFERLETAEAEARLLAHQISSGNAATLNLRSERKFNSAVVFMPESGATRVVLGSGVRHAVLTPAQQLHVGGGGTAIAVAPCASGAGNCAILVQLLDRRHAQAGVLQAEINSDYLWDSERMPENVELCISGGNVVLSCGKYSGMWQELEEQIGKSGGSDRFFGWKRNNTSYDAAYWNLFLNARFQSSSLTVVVTQEHAEVLAPMKQFRATFPYIMLLVIWVVLLLSSVQIRRTLVPLEELTHGTEQIGAHNFAVRVDVQSGDEFERLAHSFNSMATRLGTQFHALETLKDIEQAILASRNRDGIIAAVLKHLPDLLPHSGFGVALLSDPRLNDQPSLTASIPGRGIDRRLSETSFSMDDLQCIGQKHRPGLIAPGERIPEFLMPLAGDGMASFLVLPLHVDDKPFGAVVCAHSDAVAITDADLEPMRQVVDQVSVAFSNVKLIEALEQLHWGALSALARAIDAKSAWTAGHSERVTLVALKIGRAMSLSARDLQIMNRGGLLHDIGKIGTPPEILDKAGRLDGNEMQIMRDHVRVGLRILEPIPEFAEALPIVAQHHEWFDGSGYPECLAGEQISLHARIFAVADCYDALISDRPYRPGLPLEKVLEILKSGSGKQFDPRVIEIFLSLCAQDSDLQPRRVREEVLERKI